MSGASPRLVSLATATPPHVLGQDLVARHAVELFGPSLGGAERLAPIFRNAAIEERRASAPIEWFLRPHTFAERNDLFLATAVDLLAEAAGKALVSAGIAPGEVDVLVTVCSTGVATPALDARLMEVLPFRRDVRRLPVFGLGCAGGVLGLSRAAAMARADEGSVVLLLVVELCALTFRHADRSKSNLVAAALFGDGAAAAVIRCGEAPKSAPVIGAGGEHTWPASLDVMGWEVADDGLKVVFSRDIPSLVRGDLRPVVDAFLAKEGLSLADIDGFVCHPGGARVLDALESVFELEAGALSDAREILRRFGNMSAATVLFVLQRSLDRGIRGRLLLTTLGPGFTAGMLLIEARD